MKIYLNKEIIFFIWLMASIMRESIRYNEYMSSIFAYLLALLACQSCFYLVSLTVGLVLSKAKSINQEVAIDFFKCFL